MKLPQGQTLFNWIIGAIALVVILNLAWINWRILKSETVITNGCDLVCITNEVKRIVAGELAKVSLVGTESGAASISLCDRDCVEKIVDEKLVSTPSPTTVKTSVTPKPTAAASKTSFVNLSGGTAGAVDWVQVDDTFWLDTSLYGPNVVATWEGRLAIQDGNGIGYARLYDMTNNRGVDGSQVQVSNGDTISFYSGNLALWRGQNQYRIEVRSTTGYPVTVSSARLKLIY